MTQNRRIFLNIIATYGRSLYALIIGLFCGRWTLMVLGETDYGLMGLVGGLTSVITLFSGIFAAAVGRFYAFAVGESQKIGREAEGLENCRKWFNTALSLYTVIPLLLVLVGYPIGAYAVRHWLTIPADRIEDCVWVFRFVCVSCFIGMSNVPFAAMYTAKQYIAELTIYSVLTSTFNVIALYYMLRHPGVWLSKFMFLQMLFSVLPQIFIMARALWSFPECKIRPAYLFNWRRFLSLAQFAWWKFFGDVGALVRSQGFAILVNKMFGPRMNASMSIGQTIASQTDTLAASMNGAFSPAITNLAGAGEKERMLRMAYRVCKLGGLLSMLFVLPLSLEIHAIINLWLKKPPALAAEVALLMLMTVVVDEMGRGIGITVTAWGKLALYYLLLGCLNILSLPLAWFVVWTGLGGFLSVFTVLLAVRLVAVVSSAFIAQHVMGFEARHWLRHVFAPLVLLAIVTLTLGSVPHWVLCDFFWLRILTTVGTTVVAFVLLAWKLVLEREERDYIWSRVMSKFGRVAHA